jgi:hypothetical protein
MPEFIVNFFWKKYAIKSYFISGEKFNEYKKIVENDMIENLKKGNSLQSQIIKNLEIMDKFEAIWNYKEEFDDEDSTEFSSSIITLKKLRVIPNDFKYGWLFDKKKQKRRTLRPCIICQVETKMKCSCCRRAYYCCADHQKADWKNHRDSIKNKL